MPNLKLDSPEIAGRVRGFKREAVYSRARTVPTLNAVSYSKPSNLEHNNMVIAAPVLKGNQLTVEQINNQSTDQIKKHRIRSVFNARFLTSGYFISGLAVSLLVVGAIINLNTLITNKNLKTQVASAAAPASDPETVGSNAPSGPDVDESPPPANINNYTVAPDLPRFLSIPGANVYARVKRVGVTSDNTIIAPKSVYDVGWYEGSAKPGDNGTVFLDGHVSGPTKGGVFLNIKKLKEGDKITIERGDGKKISYKVVAKEIYDADKVDMAKALRSIEPGKNGLNIMTCNGKYNQDKETFDHRLVVYAVQE